MELPKMTMPAFRTPISVVIPYRAEKQHLQDLLRRLGNGFKERGIPVEIVVVATGKDSVTPEHIQHVKWVSCPGATPAMARNIGSKFAGGRWLAFLDADISPTGEWFNRVREYALGDESRVVVGWPVLVPPTAAWVARAWQHVAWSRQRLPRYVNSGNLLLPRVLFLEIGGFDEHLVAGEDVDICRRLRARGAEVKHDENLAVWHLGEPTDIGGFFKREIFHAAQFRDVALGSLANRFDAALLLTFLCYVVLIPAAVVGTTFRDSRFIALGLAGPIAALLVAVGKALPSRDSPEGKKYFSRSLLLCFVMVHARLLGSLPLASAIRFSWVSAKSRQTPREASIPKA